MAVGAVEGRRGTGLGQGDDQIGDSSYILETELRK